MQASKQNFRDSEMGAAVSSNSAAYRLVWVLVDAYQDRRGRGCLTSILGARARHAARLSGVLINRDKIQGDSGGRVPGLS